MKRSPVAGLLLFCLLVAACEVGAQPDSRYGGDPLLLGAGARALGMGSAFVAVSDDATAVYWNPAGLVRVGRREAQAQHAEQFGGTVNHDVLTLAVPSSVGGLGVGLLRLGVDGISLTALEDPSMPPGPENRPVVSAQVGTSDYTLYLAYGRAIRPGFSAGISLKLIWRNLHAGNGFGYGMDLGTLYAPSAHLSFAAVVRNATRTRIAFDSGAADHIPPSLLVGAAYTHDIARTTGRLTWSISLHAGGQKSESEDTEGIQAGAEYVFRDRLAFRVGSENGHFTAGAGVRFRGRFGLDLAFLENGQLDNSYRISAFVGF